jgi:TusA-related sulfurtransferase
MQIDGRGKDVNEVLLQLRAMLSEQRELDSLEVLIDSRNDTNRVKAFALMSGCMVEYREQNGHYRLVITGGCGSCG